MSRLDRRSFLEITLGSTLALGLPTWSHAQGRRLGKIEYGVASVDAIYATPYVALKKNFFEAEGLEVAYLNSQSGPRSKQMLAAQQLFVTTTGANDSVALTLSGKPSVIVFGLDNRVGFANILVNKELHDSGKVKRLEDLAGQTLAVTQPQAATWLMAVYILDRVGVKDKVTIRGLGDFVTMMGAVKTKQAAATMATVSMIDKAREEGWGVPLFDVTDQAAWGRIFGGDLPGVCCYVLEETAKKRADVVQAFVNGMVKGADFVNTQSAEAIADVIYTDYLSGFPREAVVKAINIYKNNWWNRTNVVSKESYDRLLGIMGGGRQYSDEELKRVPYEVGADMSFVRKARKL
jgi:NitT/TauT family transport system substrate-binding protein